MFLSSITLIDRFAFIVVYHKIRIKVVFFKTYIYTNYILTNYIITNQTISNMAVEGAKKENLSGLSAVFLSQNSNLVRAGQAEFRDYEMLFDYIDSLADNGERTIIAIDEYPYLAASYPVISSMIQKHIDQCWKDSNLFLLLCSSSMSFMEEQVLGYKSPLYGRRTAQFKIHPFSFWEAKEMLPGFTGQEQAVLYGVTGGIPEYLSRINNGISLDENIIRLFFDESGHLFEEPVNLMKQELKEPMTYHSIIAAIASGASRLNEIATKTGLESGGCSNQLSSLIALQIVRKEIPVTESENSRKTLYRLEDSMYLFWYRFVRPYSSSIMCGVGRQVYETIMIPQMNDFMGTVFENICKQYLFLPEVY